MKVKAWSEQITIPTYEVGEAEKNPVFLEKRIYQGSSGSVYPYPVIESVATSPTDRVYNAVYIENEYLKVMILPELGGRVQMAYDKIKKRHFIYYNNVIKPALVGLLGPWISGGIEFNWPQHHRPSTYIPVDYTIEELKDGGVVVWVNEQERMTHQKGAAGFTLRPGSAVLEIQGCVSNPTPVPQTFLWWANPAVVVNDGYQSVFPPDVNAVFDHGKRAVSSFPIATGEYYKYDYSRGVDISRYKNIPVPTSYMSVKSGYDFVGGYENDIKAGVLHVANHNISPGKKQWTWGNGDFGVAWDRNLTDVDGPYIELMAGVYTDNQPDFSWLQPYEQKSFVQYFIPYRDLGVVKQASSKLMMNIEEVEGGCEMKILATLHLNDVLILVANDGDEIVRECRSMTPLEVESFTIGKNFTLNELQVSIISQSGEILLKWEAEKDEIKSIPEPAKAAIEPEDVKTVEELFLTGQHIEQIRHATYSPVPYYLEGLKRDSKDIRCNNAMGLWLLRRGQFAESLKYFTTAIERQTERNPNPYDGEPYYNQGLAYKFLGDRNKAYEAFYKSCWNSAWQDPGYYSLAQISMSKCNYAEALSECDKSLTRNWNNHRARHLKSLALRKLTLTEAALSYINDSLDVDKFNFGCLIEQWIITGEGKKQLLSIMRNDSHNYEEIAWDYFNCGCYEEAVKVLDLAIENCSYVSATVHYAKAYNTLKMGDNESAKELFIVAQNSSTDYCFPNRLECVEMFESVIKNNSNDAKAPYYLGNLWYDKRQYNKAIEMWELSVKIDDEFPTALRNLSLAYFNKLNRKEDALSLLERAFELNEADGRILMELDQLYKRLNRDQQFRLALLKKHFDLVKKSNVLYLSYVTLHNQIGAYSTARDLIDSYKFQPWEGGEGAVPAQYQLARIELAKELISQGKAANAVTLLEECYLYPHNLGEGKLIGAQENDINYHLGCAYECLGNNEQATYHFTLASEGNMEPAVAMYYNDQKPDKIFYQGLALRKLGYEDEANSKFNKLIAYAKQHYHDVVKIDYFAVSLPDLQIWEDDLTLKNRIHCNYLLGLGHIGLGNIEAGVEFLQAAYADDLNHQGVQLQLLDLNSARDFRTSTIKC